MKEIMVSMVDYFRENRRDIGKGLELLPGVRNLLETLSGHPDVVFGLVSLREPDFLFIPQAERRPVHNLGGFEMTFLKVFVKCR